MTANSTLSYNVDSDRHTLTELEDHTQTSHFIANVSSDTAYHTVMFFMLTYSRQITWDSQNADGWEVQNCYSQKC